MAFKVFLDANVLLDFLQKKNNHEDVKQLIRLILNKKIQGFVTPSVLQIVAFSVARSYGNQKAKELLLLLLTDIIVVDGNHDTTIMALHSKIDDIEAAMEYYTALHHKLNFFVTRDHRFSKAASPTLPVCSVSDFLKLFSVSEQISAML